jgi:hypothetical protein
MWKLVLCVALPALAIIVAALAQLLLTTIWPAVQHIHFPGVSADSYFVILLVAALCFFAAAWLQRNVRIPAGNVESRITKVAQRQP